MWIRSQDKKYLFDVKGCFINQNPFYGKFGPDEGYHISGFTHCEFYLGTYKTKEKAMKVLDELQCRIARTESGVFQMPEDD